jgi:pimeloyl-ACP methyl ester carboxylesterase
MTAKVALMTALATSSKLMECTITCSDGMILAAQQYTAANASSQRILCLHGWLDNCRTFWKFAPALANYAEVVALDFPGHGLSSHKSPDGTPALLSEGVYYVAEAVKALEWDSFILVGHSMGAAISSIYAAAFPEQILKLVLLEGGGPLTRNPKDTAKHIRSHVEKRQAGNPALYGDSSKGPRLYPSLEKAIETRMKTAQLSPGRQYLSETAARELVTRAIIETEGGVQFRHDPRLQWPSLQYYTNEQNDAIFQDIQCPVCLLLSTDGWPIDADRLAKMTALLQPQMMEVLPGSHHFHADPDDADAVIDRVMKFIA